MAVKKYQIGVNDYGNSRGILREIRENIYDYELADINIAELLERDKEYD